MKIRATKKLINISRVAAGRDSAPVMQALPGEWYADLVSMGLPGKSAIHFLHTATLISVLIPGRSLNKVLPELPVRASALLRRHGYSELISRFALHGDPEICSTNSRVMIGHMINMRYNLEYHLAFSYPVSPVDLDRIEDLHTDYLFGGKSFGKDHVKAGELLRRHLDRDRPQRP